MENGCAQVGQGILAAEHSHRCPRGKLGIGRKQGSPGKEPESTVY